MMNSTGHDYFIITEFQNIDLEKWSYLLDRSGCASPFQSPEYYKLISAVDGYEPFIVVVGKNEEYLALATGVVQNEKGWFAYFSRRAIIEGGIILAGKDTEAEMNLLITKLVSILKKKAIYLEIRNYCDYSKYKKVFDGQGFMYLHYLNFQVDCTDAGSMKQRISKGKLRQVNSTLKAGASIITAETERQVREFYELLADLYLAKVKKPLPPWIFFRDFRTSGLGVYLLISHEDKIVGGIMCPYDRSSVYEWYVAGLDGKIDKVYPSVLATWAAMDFAHKNNIPRFDFMGAGQPDQDYGVREFKSRFGGVLVEHGRFRKIFRPLLFQVGRAGLYFLSKIR